MTDSLSVAVKGVTRRFGSTWVLKGVDVTFSSGSLTVVYGANGAGKSTLLGILGGLVQPSAGSVCWEPGGEAVGDRRERVGWVGHEAASYRELTVQENVELVARAHGVDTGEVRICLERVDAGAIAGRRVGSLSRGQKQRVALARGIVHSPKLLLLDEPFTGLDARGSTLLESILLEESGRGAIVVVVSHDVGLASRLAAESLWIERGRARSAPVISPV